MNKKSQAKLLAIFVSFLIISSGIVLFVMAEDEPLDICTNSLLSRECTTNGVKSLEIFGDKYYNGTDYVDWEYGLISGGFRDNTGAVYKLNNGYIDVYSINETYFESFGFGITGDILGTSHTYTSQDFPWTWNTIYNETTNEYIFRGYNNDLNFNWTQEFHFFPDKEMKITHYLTNNLGNNILNTKFWYIHTINNESYVEWNDKKYYLNESIHLSGNYDNIIPNINFPEGYTFNYEDLIDNNFNITNIYIGDGSPIGVDNVWLLAIGVTKNDGVFPNGASVVLDPSLNVSSGTTSLGGNLEYDWVEVASGATLSVNGTGYLNITADEYIYIYGIVVGTGQIGGGAGGQGANGGAGSGTGAGGGGVYNVNGFGGGGGAGYGGGGGTGATGADGATGAGGAGGSSYGNQTDYTLFSGSGGGGGGGSATYGGGGGGGSGAGYVQFIAPTININGTINLYGANGANGNSDAGGGGGGSAGTFLIKSIDVNLDNSIINLYGGVGGNGQPTYGSGGGGGGGGRLKVFYEDTYSITSTAVNLNGGGGGTGDGSSATGASGGVGTSYYLQVDDLGFNTAPTLTANTTKPDTVYTNIDWLINLTATDPEEDYLDSYVQFYVNDSKVGSEYTFNMTNNTNHLVATLGSGNFSKTNNLTAEVWLGDGTDNSTKVNLTITTVSNSIPTTPTVTYPTENLNLTTPFYINWTTAGDLDGDDYNASVYLYNTDGTLNTTLADDNITDDKTYFNVISAIDGIYRINITLCDATDCSSTLTGYNLTIDTTYPLISLIYPTAVNYTSVQTQLNFTKSDTNLAGCWYNLGGANSSYDETCANISGLDSGQGTSTWTIYVNDSSGNENSSSITFFVDSENPSVDIIDPKPQTYSYNESLELNYTITDTNLESCWYKVVNSTGHETINNTTITDCLNTTFNVPRSDDYTLTLYSNDTLGNENLDTVTFQISLASPSIVLDYPTDNLWLTEKDNIYFNFTATDTNGLDVCEIWTNSTGIWHKNVTFSGVISGTQNYTQINLAETKGYIWNVWCNDTTGLEDWALNNFTFNVDTINPLIEYTTGTENNNTNFSRNYIFVNVTASDTNENNIVFRLYNQTSQVNSTTYTTQAREINWTNLPDEIYTYNVTITDDSGRSNTTTLRTITLDDTAPTINIIHPQAINYADNNTVELNYTVSDNLIGLDTCWYKVVNSTDIIISNTTIIDCLNTTFSLPTGDIDYNITLYANDTLGNENSDLVTFGIRTESPVIVLTPTNNTHTNNGTDKYFNFTVTTNADSITNCSLYGNFNGTWLLNQTILIPVQSVNTNFSAINLLEGDYIWNVLCYDDLGTSGWADNLSFTVDLTNPSTIINSITLTTNSKTFWFNHTTTDTNIDSCKYSIFDATGGIDGGNENVSFTCGTGRVNATVTDYATYNLTIYAIDLANNENSTTTAFTTSESAPAPPGGGGTTTIEAEDLGYCGDGVCNETRGETFFNCPEDCSQEFHFPNLDEAIFFCFDDDPETECVWATNPGLFIVLAFMLFTLMFTILFEFKKEAVGLKKWTFKPKKRWSKWRR